MNHYRLRRDSAGRPTDVRALQAFTESEARLRSALKARQLGVSFRRQGPLAGQFIADFFASSVGLVVEVDVAIHARKPGPDARRDLKLRRLGYRVIRVSAELVLRDLSASPDKVGAPPQPRGP